MQLVKVIKCTLQHKRIQSILGAIAQATKNIKIASSATVLSVSDPVRVLRRFCND